MHPLVKSWFIQKFQIPTEPQKNGWPAIIARKTTLISSPTGSGKTLAAFLVCIDALVRKALDQTLEAETEILYISPLKALSNDIQKNLLIPLQEITALAKKNNIAMMPVEVGVRSGDTLPKERQAMLKKPPHILITTPESFYLLLTAEKSRALLASVKTVIIDEIHALANNKRGTHVSLSLERLEVLAHQSPLRIGLSATQKPLSLVADFLKGNRSAMPVEIIHTSWRDHLDLAVEIPKTDLGAVTSNQHWDEIYDRLASLALENRSTLVFANTRKLAERTAHHLAERLGKEKVLAHHGSLSRKLRLDAENKLKQGQLTVLVATASLELGIDIGDVDLVCQLGSPRAISVMVQRAGRAGHWKGGISKARIFATTLDELLECASLIHAMEKGELDTLIIPQEPLDILSQQIIATCATGEWEETALFNMVKYAFPYRHLSRETFEEIIHMLSEGITGARGRYAAYLYRDPVHKRLKGRRGSRLVAITSGGAIPDNALFTVFAEPGDMIVGTLDEDFAIESHRGDIILLGSNSWKILRVESTKCRVFVEDAHGAPPTIPFWVGEAPGRTNALSKELSQFRQSVSDLLPDSSSIEDEKKAQTWLMQTGKLSAHAASQITQYILQTRAILQAIPTQQIVIAERFFDESGGMQLIIHAPFGSRINKAWGLALRKCFCQSFNFELQAVATDNGINISLSELHSFPLNDVFHFLNPKTLKKTLIQAVVQSPLFTVRWRWVAGLSLAMVRFRNGKKIPPNILRMIAEDLLASIFPDAIACQDNIGGREVHLPDHPLVQEALNNALTEAMDIDGLIDILHQIQNKSIQCLAIDTPMPSPFAHEILNANPYAFLDDAPLEERRSRAVMMRQILPESLLKDLGKLDTAMIELVKAQTWPDVRDADELHDSLQTWIAFPADHFINHPCMPAWKVFMDTLIESDRAAISGNFWYACDKSESFFSIYTETPSSLREENMLSLVKGWMLSLGPITVPALSHLLHLLETDIYQALVKLEASGLILRGYFSQETTLEWCERRLLARIHRLTLGRLREEIQPVTFEQFKQWLYSWQHVTPGTQLQGEQGLLEILQQLQGFEIPAKAWESDILRKRIQHYDPHLLDKLCLMGKVGWGRFSALHTKNIKRIVPTSIAPITFFFRENSQWLLQKNFSLEEDNRLSHIALSIYDYLKDQGASFFPDIVYGVSRLKSEVALGLWELTSAGLITADSFDNLRALIDPKRRLKRKRFQQQNPYSIAGRWSLLKIRKQENEDSVQACCSILLKRYGVIYRDLLTREKLMPPWRELLKILRRLEARGEIRGGLFIQGVSGEQFALPSAMESLRAMRRRNDPLSTLVEVSTVDPLNFSNF